MTSLPNPYDVNSVPSAAEPTPPPLRNSLAFRMFVFSIAWVIVCTSILLVLTILGEMGIVKGFHPVIHSLEFSIVAGIPVGIILIVQARRSLRQIKQQKQTGKGYAITAIALGWLISLVGLVALGVVSFVFMTLNGVI